MAYIRIDRKLFEHFLWEENRVYSKAEAWIDLIQLMCYKEFGDEKLISGVTVKFGRGQYPISHNFLSKRWNWSVHKVRTFITLLKGAQQVAVKATSVTTILTLCNYELYNPISQAEGQAKGRRNGKRTAGRERSKEVLEEVNEGETINKDFLNPKKNEKNGNKKGATIEELREIRRKYFYKS